MDDDVTVSNRAWLELLHAEVCWTLAGRGVDVLVIKGPSIGEWLYPQGDRESADVDLLLRPSQWDAAVAALEARGFEPTYSGFRETESSLHSLDLQRTDPTQGQHGLDLHLYFPGIDADPEDAFDVLWADRALSEQAGIPVWFPSLEARALIIALHAARQPGFAKTEEDLRRAMAALAGIRCSHWLSSLASWTRSRRCAPGSRRCLRPLSTSSRSGWRTSKCRATGCC